MKRILRESGAMAVVVAVGTVAPLLMMVYVTRTTTLAAYGAYAAVQALIALLEIALVVRASEIAYQTVAPAWLEGRMADVRTYAAAVVGQETRTNWVVYLGVVAIAWALGPTIGIEPVFATLLGLALPLQIGYGLGKCLLVTAGDLRAQVRGELSSYAVLFLAQAFLFTRFGLVGLAIGTALGVAWRTAVMRLAVRRHWPRAEAGGGEVDQATALATLRRVGRQATLRNLLVGCANNADTVLAGTLAGPEAAATYKVARSLAGMAPKAAVPIWSALRPRMIVAWTARDLPRLRRLIGLPGLALAAVLIPAYAAATAIAPEVIVAIFGEAYRVAAAPFLYLFAGLWIFGAVTGWFSFYAVITGNRHAGITINLILNAAIVIAIAAYGYRSATALAGAVAAALAFTSVFCWALFARHTRDRAASASA